MSEPPHQVFHLCCWACVECTMRVRNCVGAQLRQRSLGRCEAAASLLGRLQVLDDVEVGPPDMCAGLRPCTLQYFCRPGTLMYIYAQKLACTRTHTQTHTTWQLRTQAPTRVRAHVRYCCKPVRLYPSRFPNVRACMYTGTHVDIHVCTYIYIYIYMRMHTGAGSNVSCA